MKFECTTEHLLSAASLAVRFIERRPNLPALSSILISSQQNELTLRATNLECGVEISLPARVITPNTIAVPGAVLAGFISHARGKSISASLQGNTLKLETERVSASLKTIPYEDFPTLPRVSAEKSFAVKASDLARAIRSVVFCASSSMVKPELQSVLLYGENSKLVAVATDSFRLAEKAIPLRKGGSVPQLLLPARNAAELVRILETATGDAELYYSDNQLSTHLDRVYYTSRLLDGTFPNYRQIVPKSFTTEAVVLREDFGGALKSLAVFADRFSQIVFSVEPSRKSVLLSSRNPDVGEETCTVHATLSGDAVSMSFNGRYLADSLQAIAGESVRLHSNGVGKPLLIKDASDNSFFYLAMPMNR